MSRPTFATPEEALAFCVEQLQRHARALSWSSREGDETLHHDAGRDCYVSAFHPAGDGPPQTALLREDHALERMRTAVRPEEEAWVVDGLIRA